VSNEEPDESILHCVLEGHNVMSHDPLTLEQKVQCPSISMPSKSCTCCHFSLSNITDEIVDASGIKKYRVLV